jgi:spermidine synthase
MSYSVAQSQNLASTPQLIAKISALTLISVLFCASGASSLIFETLFARLLTYTFGNTAYAASTVLAAFLGGLALGAWLVGAKSSGARNALRLYAILEFMIGVYCLFIPQLFRATTKVYVALHPHLHSPNQLTLVRFLIATLFVLVPSFLMGGTLPVLAHFVITERLGSVPEISSLYGWNTLGAALGTVFATFVLVPCFGITGTVWLACGMNFSIFGLGICLSRAFKVGSHVFAASVPDVASTPSDDSPAVAILLLVAFLTGASALGYEVIWTHIQAFTIGNTVYAFGTMLFTVLCGLGLGAQIVARRLKNPHLWVVALIVAQALAGVIVFFTLPLWGLLNPLFEHGTRLLLVFGGCGLLGMRVFWIRFLRVERNNPSGTTRWVTAVLMLLVAAALGFAKGNINFVITELIRFLCAFYLLIIPATLIGVCFPLLLNLTANSNDNVGLSVGRIYGVNTLGAILGALLTGFFVLPRLGSEITLRTLASFNLMLAVILAIGLYPSRLGRKTAFTLAAVGFCLLAWFVFPRWNPRRLMRGSYVYFLRAQSVDDVLYRAEDVQGGVTSVVRSGSHRVLLSNAKFQGDNSGEVAAQSRFALIPALFARRFERALVIGLGTGNTLRTVSLFPFKNIDIAELSPHIVDAARGWFADVNARVFDRDPRVSLHIDDGRNFLLLTNKSYDLITIEISSIWISGEADLYNRDFYELCRDHLATTGVLQQWVQLHHMSTESLLTIFNTAGQVFPHLAFFVGPTQGLLLASMSPLEFNYTQVMTFDHNPAIQAEVHKLGAPSLVSLLGEIQLYGGAMRQAIASLPSGSWRTHYFISTDFHPFLEYQTPKGNALPYDTIAANWRFLRQFRQMPLPSDLATVNLSGSDDRNLLLGFVTERQGNKAEAISHFEQVEGRDRVRAQTEIERIRTGTHY